MDIKSLFKKKNASPAAAKGKPKVSLRQTLQKNLKVLERYQVTIIAIAVFALLALTSLRMLNYADPPVDDAQIQKNLEKFQQIRINPVVVEKIKNLKSGQTTPTPNLDSRRTSPFAEPE